MNIESNDKISIRRIEEKDITSIVNYFLNASKDFLNEMGVNPEKLPMRENWIQMISDDLLLPVESRKFYYLIWLFNDKAIGHSNLTNIDYNKEAFMHLHMWDATKRKAGIGTELIRLSLKHYFEDFGIKKLHCEPFTLNNAPNKALEKVGFDFIKEYTTTPGWICFEQPVKRWLMTAEKFNLLKQLQPILTGEFVYLKPIYDSSFEDLYRVASDPLIWEQHPNKNRYKREVFKVFFKGALESQSAFLIYDNACNLIGSTRYYDLNLNESSIAIGYTFISRSHWGKEYNREAKKLLLNHVFSFVDNVIFHIGENNIRSQKAIERIGAVKIGAQEMSYYGEDNKLNYVYQINKQNWNKN
ncbi:MAG: GNAT family N-acetyltransferase [Saprospiraceae bacterium]|nr:GNAT family N-acetyltransferase [Saprospiraceae bacterium]